MAAGTHARRVGIIGCGLIGRGWGIVFARSGYEVLLHDAPGGAAERALATIDDNLRDLADLGLIGSRRSAGCWSRKTRSQPVKTGATAT